MGKIRNREFLITVVCKENDNSHMSYLPKSLFIVEGDPE